LGCSHVRPARQPLGRKRKEKAAFCEQKDVFCAFGAVLVSVPPAPLSIAEAAAFLSPNGGLDD
jgi:hypothetical protein